MSLMSHETSLITMLFVTPVLLAAARTINQLFR